ncbi:MAG: hypothetical protein K8R21_06715, partial [Leptospira sp.]|nr:hypothetical protein [Leptospira sp.]
MAKEVVILADIYESFSFVNPHLRQEWESFQSIEYLRASVEKSGYKVILIEPAKDKRILLSAIDKYFDPLSAFYKKNGNLIFFNLIEGFRSRNRESYVPGFSEFFGFPHTGSDAFAQCISLNKDLTKKMAAESGLPVKQSVVLHDINEISQITFPFPVFAKPADEGSSLGIFDRNVIRNRFQLVEVLTLLFQEFDSVMVEEYIDGPEFTLGIVGNKGNFQASKVARITYPAEIYSHEIKSKEEMIEKLEFGDEFPFEKEIQSWTICLCEKLRVSGYARADWKFNGSGIPFFLELNLTPGLSFKYSSFPVCYEATFGDYDSMIKRIIDLGFADYHSKRFDYS